LNVKGTLIEEMIAVSIVILLFFSIEKCLNYSNTVANICCYRFHFAQAFGISSNIMSLTGIALAIGVVVDDGIVMVENAYRTISEKQEEMDNNQ
jgi:Cu(I)/Ag(I) efflux system membrane protein CusA/SilA